MRKSTSVLLITVSVCMIFGIFNQNAQYSTESLNLNIISVSAQEPVSDGNITLNVDGNGTDYMPFLSNPQNVAILICTICTLFFYIVIQSLEFYKHPSIIVSDEENMERVYLGRFIDEKREDKLRLWKMRFKTYTGIQTIYSELSFSEFNLMNFDKFANVWWFLPFTVLCKKSFETEMEITSDKMIKCGKNYCRVILGTFLNIFQIRLLAIALFDSITYEKTKVKSIKFLMALYLKEQLDISAQVQYTKLNEFNKETNTKETIVHTEVVPYLMTKTLPADPTIQDFKVLDILVNDKLKIANIDDAKKNFVSRITERAIFKIKCLEYERINEENYNLYKTAEDQLIDTKLAQEKEVDQTVKNFLDTSKVFRQNIYEVLQGTFGIAQLGAKVDAAATTKVEEIARNSLDKHTKLNERVETLESEKRKLQLELDSLKLQEKTNGLTFRPGFFLPNSSTKEKQESES